LAAGSALNLHDSQRTQIAMTDKPPAADPAAFRQRVPLRRGERLRRRAAWMYYVEEMTQSAVAEALGVGRVTVVRMLAEARALGEVRIALARGVADLAGLEIALAKALGVGEAIVAPLSAPDADPTAPIGAALGAVISELVADDMKIGLGWGLTLRQALDHLSERAAKAVTVVSLVGGVTHVGSVNPAEFAWEFARAYNADCYLIPAPALVDSAETRQALIERCGLAEVYDFARRLDAVVFGVGALDADSTIVRFGLVSETERHRLREYGAVGEALCYVYSAEGRLIDHPINGRVMSAPLETVAGAPIRVMAAGGAAKIEALRGAARLLRPTTLVTDEATARTLLAALPATKAR
jgi:DNA-binding transcriptional regulator LsrR (DeoR family)